MTSPLLYAAATMGFLLWVAGVNLLYNFLELVDALRPEKPDEKPVARWALWSLACVVLSPLVAVLGVFRLATIMLGFGHRFAGAAPPSRRLS